MLKQEVGRADLDTVESLMAAAWPAVESSTADGWLLRSAAGVTQRANSIVPLVEVADPAANLDQAVKWYSQRRQPVIFQLTHRPENATLETFLDARGYSRQSETVIMTARPSVGNPLAANASAVHAPVRNGISVMLAPELDDDWLELWWSVDGRGGETEKQVARRIVTGVPAIYATARNQEGTAVGTGRLTQVEISGGVWGGIYCMATHPDFRRQGVAAAVMQALTIQALAAGTEKLWLMVTAANTAARGLYKGAGFSESGRYHYRQAP